MNLVQGTLDAIWRQRLLGGALAIVFTALLSALGLVPLPWPAPLAFPALLAAQAVAWRTPPPHRLGPWALAVADVGLVVLLMRVTGGAASPFQATVYPWLFGVALAHMGDGLAARVPGMVVLGGLALAAGAWGSPGWGLFTAVHAMALAASGLAAATLTAERRVGQSDPLLTAVFNRGAGLERLARRVRDDEPLVLAFVDLGDFKRINDRLGHRVGDEVLQAVAGRLRGAARRGDVVVRYGGDEFVLGAREGDGAARLERLFDEPVATSAGPVVVQADIGSVRRAPGEGLEDLLERADTAMYEAKRARVGRTLEPVRR